MRSLWIAQVVHRRRHYEEDDEGSDILANTPLEDLKAERTSKTALQPLAQTLLLVLATDLLHLEQEFM